MRSVKLFFAALALVLLPSCSCWLPEKAQDKGCIVTRQLVDCTQGAVITSGPALAAIVKNLIASGVMDWDAVIQAAAGMGFKDAGCFLAQLENDFLVTAQSSGEAVASSKAKTAENIFQTWKITHEVTDVKFVVFNPAK